MSMINRNTPEHDQAVLALMIERLDKIYTNKSGDEYKMHGDITLSPVYDLLQRTIADLSTIKGLNKIEIEEIKKMFNALHRPNFKKVVSSYIAEKKSSAIIMTATFTVAYRVLIGELSRIYTSTEATENGFVYKPDKYSKKNDMSKFIRNFNLKIDSELNKSVRATTKKPSVGEKFQMEGFILGSSARFAHFISDRLADITPYFREFGAWCRLLFPDISVLNPISWFSNFLSNRYDKKVDKYHDMAKLYLETKQAYEEYMEKPAFRRNKKIEEKYKRMMNRYNIKMLNRKAEIRDYDQRAIKEMMDEAKKIDAMDFKPSSDKTDDTKPKTSSPKKDDSSSSTTTKPEPEKKAPDKNDDPFDF